MGRVREVSRRFARALGKNEARGRLWKAGVTGAAARDPTGLRGALTRLALDCTHDTLSRA
jgi:hypothetical protein